MIRKLTMGMTLSLLLGLAPTVTASPRVFIQPRIGYYIGPTYRWYPAPWFFGPAYFPAPTTGELKISTEDKDARVYVDGGYLGIARKVKKFNLKPGSHDIELRDTRGNVLYEEKVAIVPGRTTEFNAAGVAD
jgi:PEGA domain